MNVHSSQHLSGVVALRAGSTYQITPSGELVEVTRKEPTLPSKYGPSESPCQSQPAKNLEYVPFTPRPINRWRKAKIPFDQWPRTKPLFGHRNIDRGSPLPIPFVARRGSVYELAPESQRLFLHFPPEIRNTIYGAVIANHDSCVQPALSRTCRQIRLETLELFYSTHSFHITAPHDVGLLQSQMHFPLVRHITIPMEASHHFRSFSNWTGGMELICTRKDDGSWTARFSRDDIYRRDVKILGRKLKDLKQDHILTLYDDLRKLRVEFDGPW